MAIVVPQGYEDVITTEAQLSLPLWDRVLLLLGFKLRISVSHYCQRKPEQVRTRVCAAAGDWKPGTIKEVGTLHDREVTSEMIDRFDAPDWYGPF